MTRAAIVIPMYRDLIDPLEQPTVRHLRKYLAAWDTFCIIPEHCVSGDFPFSPIVFPDEFFTSIDAYSTLLLTPNFYRRFAAYEFILICQLDALVFADDLNHWCDAGYDYIGAPVYVRKDDDTSPVFVGNGGFSLRRVMACLQVLEKSGPARIGALPIAALPADVAILPKWKQYRKLWSIRRAMRQGAERYAAAYSLNEDLFWSLRAPLFDPEFSIAPIEVASRFSVEKHPRHWVAMNGGALPFGCHAWAKWDKPFWEQYIVP